MDKKDYYRLETHLAHLDEQRDKFMGAVVPPIFQNSLFTFKDWDHADKAFDKREDELIYSRGNNPTVNIAEAKIAKLAEGERALLFGSGMAAIAAGVMHFVNPGDHIIAIKNLYGPAKNFLSDYLKRKMNIEVSYVFGDHIDQFKQAIQSNTKLVYLESPSSGIFSLQNIREIALWARSQKLKTVIDNSWASPYFQKPLTMGVDLELHSCTKYLGGHSDLVAGVLIGSKELIDKIFVNEYELLGARISPLEAWLLNRSMRTLPLRMKQHQHNALEVAKFLEKDSRIEQVYFPGLDSHPQSKLAKEQMSGYSGLMGFRVKSNDLEKIKSFFNSLEVFQIGVSWGGHESLIYALAISYLKELSEEDFAQTGLSLGDMRISVGLEHPEDLIADLDKALTHI